MKKLIIISSALGLLLASSLSLAADGEKISKEGNGNGAMACVACHGVNGEGMAASGFPRLAGINAQYLEKQLNDFAADHRTSPVMKPTAVALSVAERKAVAQYYSRLAVPERNFSTLEYNHVGETLALRGYWEKQVPACVQCHGPHGVGIGEHFPPLAGQSASYIANEIHAWKKGTRANDPLGLMKHVADALSDDDIQAVARWFANQPTSVAGAK